MKQSLFALGFRILCWCAVWGAMCGCSVEAERSEPSPVPFDAAAWRAEVWTSAGSWPTNHYTVRRRMIADLLAKRPFAGMKSNAVIAILGAPLRSLEPYGLTAWDMGYYVGLERMGKYSLDAEFLVFRFDEDGQLESFRTIVH